MAAVGRHKSKCKGGFAVQKAGFQAVTMIALSHWAWLVVVQLSPKPQLLDRATGMGMAQLTEQEGGQHTDG